MWNLPTPLGFTGFDEQKPIRFYRRHLPHWRQEGVTYFVTFRLADSLPQSKLREMAALREEWLEKVGRSTAPSSVCGTAPSSVCGTAPSYGYGADQLYARKVFELVERWLDEGLGSCLLQDFPAAKEVERCLRHDDGKRYDLFAFVIMPNHVHLLARPYSDAKFPLERLEQGFKSFLPARSTDSVGALEGFGRKSHSTESCATRSTFFAAFNTSAPIPSGRG